MPSSITVQYRVGDLAATDNLVTEELRTKLPLLSPAVLELGELQYRSLQVDGIHAPSSITVRSRVGDWVAQANLVTEEIPPRTTLLSPAVLELEEWQRRSR